jgi:hypothetical protein
MSVNYKTLFEIKVLHQYFLTGQDGTVIFEKPDQASRMKYLSEEFALNRESINEYIDFRFPTTLQDLYLGNSLRIFPTYSGCKVAVRVKQLTQDDQSIVYRPLGGLDAFDIFIVLANKSGGPGRFSAGNLSTPFQAKYLFSNEPGISPRTPPFITGNIPVFDALNDYEQGELALFGPGDIREFNNIVSGDQWVTVKATALANESDRLLLPNRFDYFISPSLNIRQGQWLLKDGNGDIIKSVIKSSTEPLSRVALDFSDQSDRISIQQNIALPGAMHSIEFSGDTGFSQTHRVLFNDALYDRANWGVVHIRTNPSVEDFRLIDDDGFIIKRKTTAGDIPHPVFEIPIKSRSAFWRFFNDRDKELKLTPDLQDYLEKDNKVLITKRPRSIARDYFLLPNDLNNQKKYLPNPESYMLNRHKDRICFDIRVPESALFPII